MSIVLTDEIRNMHFPKPLKAEEMKYYTEHFALAVLRYCFDCYDSWQAADAPDLQSEDGHAGIEVTEIVDVTPLPHNGCRPPKRRRV